MSNNDKPGRAKLIASPGTGAEKPQAEVAQELPAPVSTLVDA